MRYNKFLVGIIQIFLVLGFNVFASILENIEDPLSYDPTIFKDSDLKFTEYRVDNQGEIRDWLRI